VGEDTLQMPRISITGVQKDVGEKLACHPDHRNLETPQTASKHYHLQRFTLSVGPAMYSIFGLSKNIENYKTWDQNENYLACETHYHNVRKR